MPEQIKKRLEEEIKQLEYELTTELPAEIKKAVALGDLSENAEYHMAKQRQVFVNARLGQLKKRMGELALVNLTNIPHDKVGFGATVTVFDSSKDEELVWEWGPWKVPLEHYAGDTFRLLADQEPMKGMFVRFVVEEGKPREFRVPGIVFRRKEN